MKRLTLFVVLPLLVLAGCGFALWQLDGDEGRSGTLGGSAAPSPSGSGSPSASPGGQEA